MWGLECLGACFSVCFHTKFSVISPMYWPCPHSVLCCFSVGIWDGPEESGSHIFYSILRLRQSLCTRDSEMGFIIISLLGNQVFVLNLCSVSVGNEDLSVAILCFVLMQDSRLKGISFSSQLLDICSIWKKSLGSGQVSSSVVGRSPPPCLCPSPSPEPDSIPLLLLVKAHVSGCIWGSQYL